MAKKQLHEAVSPAGDVPTAVDGLVTRVGIRDGGDVPTVKDDGIEGSDHPGDALIKSGCRQVPTELI